MARTFKIRRLFTSTSKTTSSTPMFPHLVLLICWCNFSFCHQTSTYVETQQKLSIFGAALTTLHVFAFAFADWQGLDRGLDEKTDMPMDQRAAQMTDVSCKNDRIVEESWSFPKEVDPSSPIISTRRSYAFGRHRLTFLPQFGPPTDIDHMRNLLQLQLLGELQRNP